MEMGFSQLSEEFLLHAKELHNVRKDHIKKSMADARVEIKRIEKDIRKLTKERKASGKGSNSKLEELKWFRKHLVQYLRDTKFPKLIDSVKACGADFEKLKKDTLEKIKGEPEEKIFLIVLSNLEKFIPPKRSPQEEIDATNLLRNIINFHGIGKGHGRLLERERTIWIASKVTTQAMARDIKEYDISRYAHEIIKLKNDNAKDMGIFINENRSGYIKWDGKKFILMKRATNKLDRKTLEQFNREIKNARKIVNERKVWGEIYEKEMGKKPDKQAYYRHTQRIF